MNTVNNTVTTATTFPQEVSEQTGVAESQLPSLQEIGQILSSWVGTVGQANFSASDGPQLDAPAADLDMSDVAGLLLKLQNKSTDTQLKFSQEYIQANKAQMAAKHEERIKKMIESMNAAAKAEKSGLFGKIFGWIATAVTVIAAVAACVATGGLATGPAIAAILAVTMMALQESGAMDKMMEGLTSLMKQMGLGDLAAQIVASVIIMAAMIVVSVVAPSGATSAMSSLATKSAAFANRIAFTVNKAGKAIDATLKFSRMASLTAKYGRQAQVVTNLAKGASITTQVSGAVSGGVSGVYQSESLNAQADAIDIQKFLMKIQQRLEDEEETIRELMDNLQSSVGIVMAIMKNESEVKSNITQKLAA